MKYLLFSVLTLYSSFIIAQKHDNIWLIGNGNPSSTITFDNTPIKIDTIIRNMDSNRACTSICDSVGNLLFYTNGIWINNNQHQLMVNGDSLNPGQIANDFRTSGYPTCNSVIILPHPIQLHKYYIFHQSITYSSDTRGFGEHLYYTLVDMNANNGLGRVERKNQVLASDSLCKGQVHAVKHSNGRDWWLIQHKAKSRGSYIFLIAENNITLEHEIYPRNNTRTTLGTEWTGQCVFSPQGDRYACYDYTNDLDIYDFDRCTGLLSNHISIPIIDSLDIRRGISSGAAISASGQYLYISSLVHLYQFDLWATNIATSKQVVAMTDNFYQFFPGNRAFFNFLQLAPDGKIYGTIPNQTYLHVIGQPDSAGLACNVLQHHLSINFLNGIFTPNHPHYRMPALSCDTTVLNSPEPAATEPALSLYPNPSSGQVSLQASQPIHRVLVYNALGQSVLSTKGQEQQFLELDLQQLANGTYYITVWLEEEVISQKIQLLR